MPRLRLQVMENKPALLNLRSAPCVHIPLRKNSDQQSSGDKIFGMLFVVEIDSFP